MRRLKALALYTTSGICIVAVLIGMFFVIEQRRTQAETSAVLSAFFSQVASNYLDKSDVERGPTFVVMRTPGCHMCAVEGGSFNEPFWFGRSLKSRANLLSEPWFKKSSRTTRASFWINSVFSTDVSAKLVLPGKARAVFITPRDLGTKPGELEARFPNSFGYFVVSHIGLNPSKSEALLYVDRLCPGLCGGGEYVLLRRVDGQWRVIDEQVTWVS